MNSGLSWDIVPATWALYAKASKEASRGLMQNWLIIPASLAAALVFFIGAPFLLMLGLSGAFLVALLADALLTLYFGWLSSTLQRERLGWGDLMRFDYGLFFSIIAVHFFLYAARYIAAMFIQGLEQDWILLGLNLLFVVGLNALPEVLVVHRFSGWHAIEHAGRFTKDNWPEWFIPFLCLLSPWLLLQPQGVLVAVAGIDPLLPCLLIVAQGFIFVSLSAVIVIPLSLVLANWFMLFRASLFKALDLSTRRKRIYTWMQ